MGQPSKPEPMKRTELPSAPWQHLAADLLGPLPSKEYIFVLVDYYSRYFEVAITKNILSENITGLISKFCLTHGLPYSIHTDKVRSLLANILRITCSKMALFIIKQPPYGHRQTARLSDRIGQL